MISQNMRKTILWIILAIVIVTFVFFFGYSSRNTSPDSRVIGKVNHTPIYLSDFKTKANNLSEEYRDQASQAPDKNAFNQQIYNMAFSSLVQEKFIVQMAKKYKVAASERDIFSSITRLKAFQTEDGHFNEAYFRQIPTYAKNQLEKNQKGKLAIQYMQLRFADAGKVTDNELRDYFEQKNTTVKVAFVYKTNTTDNSLGTGNTLAENSAIQKFSQLIKKGVPFTTAATRTGLRVHTTDYFYFGGQVKGLKKNDTAPKVLEHLDAYKTAFSMKPGQISAPVTLGKGQAVLFVLKRKAPNWKNFYTKAISLRKELQQQYMQYYFSDWLNSNIQNAKIQNNLKQFLGQNG